MSPSPVNRSGDPSAAAALVKPAAAPTPGAELTTSAAKSP
jgi:hypothetical protein